MKSLAIAAALGIAGQCCFWLLFNAYGKISFGSGETNDLGGLGFLFYLPATMVADSLYSPRSTVREYCVMFIGALQFTVIAWPVIALIRRVMRMKNDA